jgi:hypothetical protein
LICGVRSEDLAIAFLDSKTMVLSKSTPHLELSTLYLSEKSLWIQQLRPNIPRCIDKKDAMLYKLFKVGNVTRMK